MHNFTNLLAGDGGDYILGIVIACVIIVALIAYFIIDRIRDKKYIAELEARREEQKRIDSEKELLRAEYRKAKKVGSDFLDPADVEKAMDNRSTAPDISKLIKSSVSVEEVGVLSDEDCINSILVVDDKKVYNQKIRTIVITTSQLNDFENGEIVNPVSLAAKGIIPSYSHYYLKIQAKGPVKKAVEVEAHEYDEYAAKMILLAGGKVTKVI